MDRIIVTGLGGAAWAAALWLIVRLRATEWVPAVATPGSPAGARFQQSTARVAGSVAGGLVAGVLVLGFGSRLLMRLLAATSSTAAQGRLTDADEVVGEITLGGTMFLVAGVGMFGGLAGVLGFSVLRRWLPRRSLAAGALGSTIGAGLVARPTGVLDPDNHDFTLLSPAWLAVVLVVAMLLMFGLLAAVLVDRWSASWPVPGRSVKGVAGVLPIALLFVAITPGLAALVAIGVGALLAPSLRQARWLSAADPALRGLVWLGAALGAIATVVAATEILTL